MKSLWSIAKTFYKGGVLWLGQVSFYDRVKISIFGQPYMQGGYILNFRANTKYGDKLSQGMSTNSAATGVMYGNEETDISWDEYLVDQNDFVDIASLIRKNPAAQSGQIVIQPFSISGNASTAPAFVATLIVVPSIDMVAQGQGTEMKRTVSLQCGSFQPLTAS